MSRPIIILGGGGHAKVLIEALRCSNLEIIGLTDPNPDLHGKSIMGVPVLGDDSVLSGYSADRVALVNGLGSTRQPNARRQLYENISSRGFSFANVVHPSAIIAGDVTIGNGVQLMAGVILQPGVALGDNVIINTRVSVDHDCRIGCHSHLAPGVVLSGEVTVGEGVHIGTGASIVNHVRIGDDSLIGAGSLVLRSIPDNVVAYGVPAEVVQR